MCPTRKRSSSGEAIMAKLSYKGTGWQCKQVVRDANMTPRRCKESASRGSDYCLRHKHQRGK